MSSIAPTTIAGHLKSSRIACAALAMAGIALRVRIALRPIDYPDRFFVPDDTFYTLNIARAMAHGQGPTADGVHLTNGFQPLLAFLMVPVFWITQNPDAALRAAMILLSVVDGALAFVLGEVARRAAKKQSDAAALAATALWAASPVAIAYALGGLETSLALLASALLALSWSRAREQETTRAYVRTGFLAGLAVLARIDTALLVAFLGLWELLRWKRGGARAVAAGGAAAVAPWWIYELIRFHTVIPSSGAAVREQVKLHQRDLYRWHLTLPRQVSMALGTILEAIIARAYKVRLYFHDHTSLGIGLSPILLALVVVGIVYWIRSGPEMVPLRALMGFGVVVWAFYGLYLAATWFFPRYLSPMHVTVTVLLALGVARLAGLLPQRIPPWTALVAVSVVCLTPLLKSVTYVYLRPAGTPDEDLEGNKGYREPVRQMIRAAPKGAVIGAFQSGALGYYAQSMRPDLRVFNMDGVVDAEAAAAFKTRSLAALAKARGMTHMADWNFNIENFRQYSGDPRLGADWPDWFRELATARNQGGFRFNLEELIWPTTMPPGAGVAAIAHEGRDQIDLFAVDNSGQLQTWAQEQEGWSRARSIGTTFTFPAGAPVAAARLFGATRTAVFAVDSTGTLTASIADGKGTWRGPKKIGTAGQFPPGAHLAASQQFGLDQTDVFAIDAAGTAAVFSSQGPDAWTEPIALGAPGRFAAGGAISAARHLGVDDRTDLFAVDRDGTLQSAYVVAAGAWSPWVAIGPPGKYPPGASVVASEHFGSPDRTDLFAVDKQGQIQAMMSNAGSEWEGPRPLGAPSTFQPGAPLVATPEYGIEGQTDCLGINRQGSQDVCWARAPAEWRGPVSISPTWFVPGSTLAASSEFGQDNKTNLFAIDKNGNLQVTSVADGHWATPRIIP